MLTLHCELVQQHGAVGVGKASAWVDGKVSLWTVDTEDSVRSLLRTSADAYITNRPDRVREWMEKDVYKRQQWGR